METNVLLLKVKTPNAPGLSPTTKKEPAHEMFGTTSYGVVDKPITNLVNVLEAQSRIPVVDQTGLTGHFDFALKWSEPAGRQSLGLSDSLSQVLTSELGLELVPGTAPVEMLVVERAK